MKEGTLRIFILCGKLVCMYGVNVMVDGIYWCFFVLYYFSCGACVCGLFSPHIYKQLYQNGIVLFRVVSVDM